jgi:hypothetical protein
MKTWAVSVACLIVVTLLGIVSGVVKISYARMIDNPVLSNPMAVARIMENQIFLKDGRVIEVDAGTVASAWEELRENGGEIEIDESDGDGFVTLWGSKRRFVCGGTAAFRIPLIPHNVDANQRALVGFGSFVEPEPQANISERPSF